MSVNAPATVLQGTNILSPKEREPGLGRILFLVDQTVAVDNQMRTISKLLGHEVAVAPFHVSIYERGSKKKVVENLDGKPPYEDGKFDAEFVKMTRDSEQYLMLTAKPSPGETKTAMEEALRDRHDVMLTVMLAPSAKVSATGSTYNLVAKEAGQKGGLLGETTIKEAKVIELRTLGPGAKYVLQYAMNVAKECSSTQQLEEKVRSFERNLVALFSPGDLRRLKDGGRVNMLQFAFGSFLHARGIVSPDATGEPKRVGVAKTENKLIELMTEKLPEKVDPDFNTVTIAHFDVQDDILTAAVKKTYEHYAVRADTAEALAKLTVLLHKMKTFQVLNESDEKQLQKFEVKTEKEIQDAIRARKQTAPLVEVEYFSKAVGAQSGSGTIAFVAPGASEK